MSTHKTKVTNSIAEEFLKKYFKVAAIEVQAISGGEESQAFFFNNNGEEYVLRLSKHGNLEYQKDKIAHDEFSSKLLPIPVVVDIGQVDDHLFFVISKRVHGKTLNEFSSEEIRDLNPKIVEVLTTIHKLKAPGEGFGGWGLNRNGPFKSWHDYMFASLKQETKVISTRSFYDENLHNSIKEQIEKLIPNCPEERAILHGDLGDLNLLSDGTKITGVIDWGDSLYGDPLKDIASWSNREGFLEEIKKYYMANGGIPKDFDKRVRCYRLLNVYGGLWFYAYSNQKKSYLRCAENANELRKELI